MTKTNRSNKYKKAQKPVEASKEELKVMVGTVKKRLPNAHFEVELENGYLVREAYVAGRMRKNYIQIALGDKVRIAMNAYDLSKGRIIFRGAEDRSQDLR